MYLPVNCMQFNRSMLLNYFIHQITEGNSMKTADFKVLVIRSFSDHFVW
jgi:hypothetical protein